MLYILIATVFTVLVWLSMRNFTRSLNKLHCLNEHWGDLNTQHSVQPDDEYADVLRFNGVESDKS